MTQEIYTVTQIAFLIKKQLESTFSYIRIKGEISNCTHHTSGHVYFSLKDTQSVLDAVCWRSIAAALPVRLEEGAEVICYGKITAYSPRSKYQLTVSRVEIAGEGALLKLLEERKRKLAAEGLFEHKKPLPVLPKVIGVITSMKGAVIRDILHRIRDRFPSHIVIWPVSVQGTSAAEEVMRAVEGFQEYVKPDLIIVARGGGSVEDLWPFNDEALARVVAKCRIPLISAIGHETDTTLIDFVSDFRAPTPTAAAEKAVPVHRELVCMLHDLYGRLLRSMARLLEAKQLKCETMGAHIATLKDMFSQYTQILDERDSRLLGALTHMLRLKKVYYESINLRKEPLVRACSFAQERLCQHILSIQNNIKTFQKAYTQQLAYMGKLLETVSYKATLRRGFAHIVNSDAKTIKSYKDVRNRDEISIIFHDGHVRVMPQDTSKN